MAIATVTQIREGLAANLATLPWQVNPYALSNPTPPCLQVVGGDIEYDYTAARGLDIVNMTVQAVITHSADVGSQRMMDRFVDAVGAESVKTLLESDRTLGGKVANLRVTRVSGDRTSTTTAGAVLVRQWDVVVYASN
jgi:hypothetical protein